MGELRRWFAQNDKGDVFRHIELADTQRAMKGEFPGRVATCPLGVLEPWAAGVKGSWGKCKSTKLIAPGTNLKKAGSVHPSLDGSR
jgi:hypothetical protein